MIVLDCKIVKLDHSDPRYPEPNPLRPFTDVYLCHCDTDDGQYFEASHTVWQEPNTENIGNIIMSLGAAVRRLGTMPPMTAEIIEFKGPK